MAKYQKYTEYKDSGVEWLGEIPSHWDFSCLKYLLDKMVAGGTPESTNDAYWAESGDGIPWVSIADITKNFEITATKKDVTELGLSVKNLQILPKNTILYSIFASLGKVSSAQVPLVTNQAILGLIPKVSKLDNRYLVRWLQAIESNLAIFSTSNTQDNLNAEKVGNLPLFNPPLNEQRSIANFLEHETAQIDTLIAKQEKLIELLKEKRQAVISHAVTKGLNPDVAMKDSGVEWLGQVPEHWQKKILKYIVSQQGGGTPDKSNLSFWDGDIPWVSPKDMKVDYISTSQDKITVKAIEQSSTKLVPIGSVLMVVRGMILIHSVPVALTQEAVTINQDMKALIPNNDLDSEYFLYLLKGLKDYLLDYVETSGHGTKCLRSDDFMNMPLFLPNVEEQKNIVQYIKNKSEVFDSLINKAESAIQLMQERRTALISSAVTGKIDVRNWQHPNEAKTELSL